MAGNLDRTTRLGQAFSADRSAVFASIQRLRTKARDAGKLEDHAATGRRNPDQSSGEQVVVIEPANPQVVYVPQYNPQTVYTTSSSTVVVQESSSSDAVAAGLIGFTAGIAIGAAIDNDYYYGPYGWRGGGYMYNDSWDDYFDEREDARDDWQDHREDLADERGDRAQNAQEERTKRQENGQQQRTEAQQTRQETVRSRRLSASSSAPQRRRKTRRGGLRERARRPEATAAARIRPRVSGAARNRMIFGYSSGRSERPPANADNAAGSSSRGGRR